MRSFYVAIPLTLASLAFALPSTFERRDDFNVSTKRGIPFNDPGLTWYFVFPGSKISWMYNWDSAVDNAASNFEFVPMLHSDRPDHTGPWNQRWPLDILDGSRHVFSFNEPDQCGYGGSCMQDVTATAAAFKQWMGPLAKYRQWVKIGAPAVTNGAWDSSTNRPMGLTWLHQFVDLCKGCTYDFINVHWYDAAWNVDYFKNYIRDAGRAANGRPVWLTEFGATGTEDEVIEFFKIVLPWLDNEPYVERYAYQWVGPGSLVNDQSSGLSRLGQAFATI